MKIQDCLRGLVGLRGVCESENAQLYVNALPGVQFKSFSELATQEDVSGASLFQTLHDEAAVQVAADFIDHLSKRKNVNLIEVISEYEDGAFHKTDFYEMEDAFVGREIYTNSGGDTIKRRLDWIEVKVKQDTVKTIHVEVDDIPYNIENYILRRGVNRIPIERQGDVIRVYLSICNVELARRYSGGKCSHDLDCDQLSFKCGYEKAIKRESFEEWQNSNIDPFRIHVSCVCDRMAIVCKYKNLLANALRYKIGCLLMEQAIFSKDKSYFVRNSKESAREWLSRVEGGENPETGFQEKSKYWRSIGQAANAVIDSLKHTECVECDGLSVMESIP